MLAKSILLSDSIRRFFQFMMPDVTSPKKQRVTETLQVAKLSKEAILPTRGSPSAAGYDLYSAHDLVI